jgi:hypothetical protein
LRKKNNVTAENILVALDIINAIGSKAYPAEYRTPFAVESPFCNTVSPGDCGPKHFTASITNKL